MNSARLEKLRIQIAKGKYPAPSQDVAKKMVDVAEKPFTFRMDEIRKRYLLRRLGIAI